MNIKALTGLFYFAVAGVAVSLGMTIYTGIRNHQEVKELTPSTIPTPAF